MAAGDEHRRAVAGADVGQGQQDIDLAAAELTVVVAELRADAAFVCARVDAGGRALAPDIGERLVDKEAVVAAEAVEVRKLGGVVD